MKKSDLVTISDAVRSSADGWFATIEMGPFEHQEQAEKCSLVFLGIILDQMEADGLEQFEGEVVSFKTVKNPEE